MWKTIGLVFNSLFDKSGAEECFSCRTDIQFFQVFFKYSEKEGDAKFRDDGYRCRIMVR